MADFEVIVIYRWQLIAAMALVLFAVHAEGQVVTGLEPGSLATVAYSAEKAQADFDHLFNEGQYQEAANSAKLTILLLLQDPDHDKLLYSRVLTKLATAQHNAGDFDAASQNYVLAIEVTEAAMDRLSNALVAPLLGLSRNNVAMGLYKEAVRNYKRALHVHQVNNGLYGTEKAEIIADLSEAYYKLGDFERANAMQESYVNVIGRKHPGNDVARLPSLFSQADMLSRTSNNYRSLVAYRRIISLIERVEGSRSLKLLPTFSAVSRLLVANHILDGEDGTEKARRYLRRAVDIAEKNDNADNRLKADAHINMGDFLSTHTANRASMIRSYRRGWEKLSEEEQHIEQRDELFAAPVLLNSAPAGSPAAMIELLANAADPDTPKNGILIVNYDVNEYGRPENIRVVESIPPDYHDYIVTNHVRNFAFRPRFIDGDPVRSPDMIFEIRFSYRDQDLPEEVRQNMPAVAATEAAQ